VRLQTPTFALLFILIASSAFGQTPRWADDRGEGSSEEQLRKLGENVIDTIGPASGPALSGEALATRTETLASEIRCPVCQGQSVQASTSEAARNMKSQIEALVAAGYSDDEVLRYFEASYGEFIRMMPRAEGFNLLVWLIPGLAMLLGALATWQVIMRLGGRRSRQSSEPDDQAPKDQSSPRHLNDEERELRPWLEKVREELEAEGG
jgi:cytochrome c-type biogenesis protein CcmH